MKFGMLFTRKWCALICALMFCSPSPGAEPNSPAQADPDESPLWSATGGSMRIGFDPGLLENLGIRVQARKGQRQASSTGDFELDVAVETRLRFQAPFTSFKRFVDGQLTVSNALIFQRGERRVVVDGFTLQPVDDRSLGLFDQWGRQLFRLDYIHIMLYPDSGAMELLNMDMSMSPWFAEQMNLPELADMAIAGAHVYSLLTVPSGAATRGLGEGCTTPNWHDGLVYETDVALVEMSRIQMAAREAGVRVAIAPDAMLKNVGTADVPWYQKFETPANGTYKEPYDRDQHPFLVWAMYRIVDDIPQQIGQSAVKHAFNSQNTGCDCSSGGILWAEINTGNGVGCGDLYSYSTNDMPTHLGVRSEIPAFTGEWEQCGSMFAPEASPPGPCAQTVFGSTSDEFERRLVVEESELQTANAEYLFEAWYVIRDDINIFNSMAHKPVTPEFTNPSWVFNPDPATTSGPAINSWVAPGTRGANQAHTVETTGNGHFSVAVKVTDLGGGIYRYVYALMNYDYDPQFGSFSMPLPPGVTISNAAFLDGDSDLANNWSFSAGGCTLAWNAPEGVGLEWGYMATFVFEANAAPGDGNVGLSAVELPLLASASVLVPGSAPVICDGFE